MRYKTYMTDAMWALWRELLGAPDRFRWIQTGNKGFSVSAVHPKLPPDCYLPVAQTTSAAVAARIASDHNAALDAASQPPNP